MKTRRVNPATLSLHPKEDEAWAIHNDERGWQICGGFSQINAECRDVDNHTLTVDALSGQLAGDILDEPCTTAGIFCRDSDRSKPRKCANYAIRFMCSSIPDRHAPPNIGVIGIVAGVYPSRASPSFTFRASAVGGVGRRRKYWFPATAVVGLAIWQIYLCRIRFCLETR
ncbi:hypothetical protein DPMN_144404 [Dreissena polymorpha]|uniref:WxxW domain-containing protein n=1 Tax=Dreissena polymorpha TaxID=45954 RepID=A0A9D4JKX8_DREPO|nr:hypothetical protein DPMN_144404 [Dreissena polymorpha]